MSVKNDNKRGQTSVEYLLLVALVVGVSILINNLFGPGIVSAIDLVVTSVQEEAWAGGEDSTRNLERPYQSYYSHTNGICVHTDANPGGACR